MQRLISTVRAGTNATEPSARKSPLRARRRRARLVTVAAPTVAAAIAAYGIHIVSYLPQFRVNAVTVSGTSELEPKLVQAYVESQLSDGSYHFISRDNIFIYPRTVLKRALTSFFPRIKEVGVRRGSLLAQAVSVSIVERQPFAQWCEADACFVLDDTGFVYAEASSTTATPKTSYVFSGGLTGRDKQNGPIGKIFSPGHLPGILALLKNLEDARMHPLGAAVADDQDFSINFGEGFYIKGSFGAGADTLVRNLQLVLSSDALKGKQAELEYVDLRFGNRVYYKLKGQEQTENN